MKDRHSWTIVGLALFVAVTLLVADFGGSGPGYTNAGSATVTPQATATEVTDLGLNTSIFDTAIGANRSISWSAIAGVATYRLELELQLVAVSATDPQCGKASQQATQQLNIDEVLPGTATSFEIPFPPTPPGDTWVVGSFNISLRAFAPDGSQLGGQGRIGTLAPPGGEGICATPTVALVPRTPSVTLPRTGLSALRDSHTARIAAGLLALAAAGLLSLSLALSIGYSRRD
jgi:hypothetical protein